MGSLIASEILPINKMLPAKLGFKLATLVKKGNKKNTNKLAVKAGPISPAPKANLVVSSSGSED